jgi:hypothetical protein
MASRLVHVLLVAVSLAWWAPGALAAPEVLSVHAHVLNVDGKDYLNFDVTNRSKGEISIYRASLPWNQMNAIEIVGYSQDGQLLGKVVERGGYPRPDALELKPGKGLSGRVALDSILPTLATFRQKGWVIVFWHYTPAGPTANLGEFGGWLKLQTVR